LFEVNPYFRPEVVFQRREDEWTTNGMAIFEAIDGVGTISRTIWGDILITDASGEPFLIAYGFDHRCIEDVVESTRTNQWTELNPASINTWVDLNEMYGYDFQAFS